MNQLRSWNRRRMKRDLLRRAEQMETYAQRLIAKAQALRSRAAGM